MAGVKTYDPKKILITFGNIILSGFDDGTFVQVEQNEDAYKAKVGASGEVARARTNDNTAKVTVTLLATSLNNDALSSLHIADRASNEGVLPLQILDVFGESLFFAPEAWIEKLPNVEYAKEVGNRAWVFMCADMQSFVGGQLI